MKCEKEAEGQYFFQKGEKMQRIQHSIRLLLLATCYLLALSASAQGISQHYAEGKLFLANGMTIEGKNLRMTMESATIDIMGQDQVLLLTDLVQIMAKQGKAKKYGANCGGSCVGAYLGLVLASGGKGMDSAGNEFKLNPGVVVLEMAIYGSLSYGIGYLAGKFSDDWEVVYLNRG